MDFLFRLLYIWLGLSRVCCCKRYIYLFLFNAIGKIVQIEL